MNIEEAKNEIKNTVRIYLDKDENGNYTIPREKQRPVLLIGAPGIGKTAIMSAVADELGIGFLGYTITHHTRQSAIGLPFISQKEYGGKKYSITEYTMSEIVAEVYDEIEKRGKKEGLLFIDEINCVSETLAPAMLELLQHKKFGAHFIPEGWILVAAGNPEEYNKSVNELDMVTLDRVKKIDVEPDFGAFRKYAKENGVHESVVCFLSLFNQYLFRAEKTADGFSFVTPRGWEDLSDAIYGYEKFSIPVTLGFISQYVQDPSAANEFFRFYKAFEKYGAPLASDAVEKGETEMIDLSGATAEERFTVAELLVSKATGLAEKTAAELLALSEMKNALKEMAKRGAGAAAELKKPYLAALSRVLKPIEKTAYKSIIDLLDAENPQAATDEFEGETNDEGKKNAKMAENVLSFGEKSLGKSAELVSAITGMLENEHFVTLITRFDCPKFYELNSELLLGNDDELKKLAREAVKNKNEKA